MEANLAAADAAITGSGSRPMMPKLEQREMAPFVVGASRSGTTLLRMMLDAHPDLAIPSETRLIPHIAQICAASSQPREDFVTAVSSSSTWRDLHLDRSALKERIDCIDPFDVGDALREMYRLYADRHGKNRWGDKTPHYVTSMQLIQSLLPEARFIHLVRDGRDVALSIRELWFGPDSVQEAASWWVSMLQSAAEQSRSLSSYLVIRYEDLILETEATLQRICRFLSLPWNESMLDYHVTSRQRLAELDVLPTARNGDGILLPEERRSIHALTALPPQSQRVGRWRQEMTKHELESFEIIAGDMLQGFGYEISKGRS
jgi:Sulfotransferase family